VQQIPRNMPKAPSFDNVQDMLKWYRKAYRIPTFKNKVKRISKNIRGGAAAKEIGEWSRHIKNMPADFVDGVKLTIDDLRGMLGLNKNKVPARITKEGIGGPKLRNYLLDQLDKSFDEALKTPAVRRSPQILIPALSKAAGIFGMLYPSSLDQENTAELPQSPFYQEDALIRQQQQQQSGSNLITKGTLPRAMYNMGGIVEFNMNSQGPQMYSKIKKAQKRKGMKKGGSVKKYARGGGIRKAKSYG
jgi:hypothetical protein